MLNSSRKTWIVVSKAKLKSIKVTLVLQLFMSTTVTLKITAILSSVKPPLSNLTPQEKKHILTRTKVSTFYQLTKVDAQWSF